MRSDPKPEPRQPKARKPLKRTPLNKTLKEKKCAECKNKFKPTKPLQTTCSIPCAIAYGKKLILKKEKTDWKEKKKILKEKLKTYGDYQNDLQKEVNHIARLIDHGHPCISSGRMKGKRDGGHFKSRSLAPSIRYNLLNIFSQSMHDNQYKSGNYVEYLEGLKKTFGHEVYKEIELLSIKYPVLKLSVEELKEATMKARQIVKELKAEEKIYSTPQRIELRKQLNEQIGVYK